jgi:hypothetical protein
LLASWLDLNWDKSQESTNSTSHGIVGSDQ